MGSWLNRGKTFKPRTARLARAPFQSKPKAVKKVGVTGGQYSTLRRTGKLRCVGNNSHSHDWRREWPSLKRELERAGITRCERCGSDYFLTPAHSLKRRHITNRTQMREVALLCRTCHEFYELQGEAKMYPAVRAIIARRPDLPTEAA